MNVLVTGAAGFIGSYIARRLIVSGVNVVGIDNYNDYYLRSCKEFNVDLINKYAGNPVSLDSAVSPVYEVLRGYYPDNAVSKGEFHFYEGDIRDFAFLESIFASHKIDKVVHLAAMAGVPLSEKKPRLYTEVNVDGTVNLLNLSVQHSVSRFVFGSSSSVYGNREDRKVSEEEDVSKPASVYGASRRGIVAFIL
jgi:UDP-glucuronate 4-epimerase